MTKRERELNTRANCIVGEKLTDPRLQYPNTRKSQSVCIMIRAKLLIVDICRRSPCLAAWAHIYRKYHHDALIDDCSNNDGNLYHRI